MRWWILWCLNVTSVVAAPDLSTVPADLALPKISPSDPAAGKRVKQVHPDWKQTEVYHVLYLPKDWQPGKRYPVIVEYAATGRIKTGLVISVRAARKEARWAMASLEAADLFGCAFRISMPTVPEMLHNGGAINRSMIRSRPWPIAKRSSHGFAGNTVGTPGAWCSVGFPEAPLPVIILACTMTKSPNCGGPLFLTATTTAYVVGAIRVRIRLRL